jgi:MFS family permease
MEIEEASAAHAMYTCRPMRAFAQEGDPGTATTVAEDPRRWNMLALIALAELLGMSVWFAANAVAPQLAARWTLSSSETGWLSTAVQLGFVLGTALAALLNLADTLASRWYFTGSAIAAAMTNGALIVAPNYRWALLCRLLTGVCLAGVYPPAMKMAATWFRERRGLAIGIVVGALTIGKAVPYLVHAFPGAGVAPVVGCASAAALLAALMIGASYRDGPAPFPRRPFTLSLVGTVLRDRQYRQVLGGYSGHMLELYACWVWIPAFLTASAVAQGQDAAASAGWVNTMSFLVLAAGAVGCVLGGELADRTGPVRLVVAAMFISGSCALLTPLVFGGSSILIVALLLVWSVSVIADSAQFSALVTRVVPPHATGTALTLQTSIGFLLTTITIQLVPVVVAMIGWRYAFPFLALGPALGILAIRRLRPATPLS